jgi:hypothetical protein
MGIGTLQCINLSMTLNISFNHGTDPLLKPCIGIMQLGNIFLQKSNLDIILGNSALYKNKFITKFITHTL